MLTVVHFVDDIYHAAPSLLMEPAYMAHPMQWMCLGLNSIQERERLVLSSKCISNFFIIYISDVKLVKPVRACQGLSGLSGLSSCQAVRAGLTQLDTLDTA